MRDSSPSTESLGGGQGSRSSRKLLRAPSQARPEEESIKSEEVETSERTPGNVVNATSLSDLPHMLTVDEVASVLRTTRAAIYTMAARGSLAGVTRVGRRLLVSRDDLIRWLRENRVSPPV